MLSNQDYIAIVVFIALLNHNQVYKYQMLTSWLYIVSVKLSHYAHL